MRRSRNTGPTLKTGKALRAAKSYNKDEDQESPRSSQEERPTKRKYEEPSPVDSALTHVSETPQLNTHLAGHTPGAVFLGTFGSDTTEEVANTDENPPTALISEPSMKRSIPAASIATSQIEDVMAAFNDYEVVAEALQYQEANKHEFPRSAAAAAAATAAPPTPIARSPAPMSSPSSESHSTPKSPPSMPRPNVQRVVFPPSPSPSPAPPSFAPSPIVHQEYSKPTTSVEALTPSLFGLRKATAIQANEEQEDRNDRAAAPSSSPPATALHNDSEWLLPTQDDVASGSVRRIPGPVGKLPPILTAQQFEQMHKASQGQQGGQNQQQHLQQQHTQQQRSSRNNTTVPSAVQRAIDSQKLEEQQDFRNGAWASMLCDKELPPYGSHRLETSLHWIRVTGWQAPVPSLIVYLKSQRSVDSEDYRAVLRDPTGVWDCNIISKCVIAKFPELTSGCVLQLQNVAVFTQRRGKHHLVITAENVVRIWPRIEMSRRELAPLSARVYDYQCIYDPKAKPKKANTAPIQPSSMNHGPSQIPPRSTAPPKHAPHSSAHHVTLTEPLIQHLDTVSVPDEFAEQFEQNFAGAEMSASVTGIGNFSRR